jgi:hypothetical protein
MAVEVNGSQEFFKLLGILWLWELQDGSNMGCSGRVPRTDTLWPNKSKVDWPNTHLSPLITNPNC